MNRLFPAVLMMQKNEGVLLKHWINYYSYLFDPGSLFVFDNDTNDSLTLSILKDASDRGVNVLRAPGKPSFENKGNIFIEKINEIHNKFSCFYLVDCDEFIVKFHDYQVFEIVKNLEPDLSDDNVKIFRINDAIWNIPGTGLGYYHEMRKLILKPNANLSYMDTGLHLYDFDRDINMFDTSISANTRIGILHFHNRSYSDMRNFSKEKLRGRVDVEDMNSLKEYCGNGRHLVKYITMSEDEYMASIMTNRGFDISSEFRKHSLAIPFFDK